jgi:hypothetical protein
MTKTKHDWTRADAMTAAEIHAAARADPDVQPLAPERLDDRFHESCHKRGIPLGFRTPTYVACAHKRSGWKSWQRGGVQLSCLSEIRIPRS